MPNPDSPSFLNLMILLSSCLRYWNKETSTALLLRTNGLDSTNSNTPSLEINSLFVPRACPLKNSYS